MSEKRNEAIVKRSINEWGYDINLNQANEELGELLVAINHYRRGRIRSKDVIEEIADVSLILDLITEVIANQKDMAAIVIKKNIAQVKQQKIDRLEIRLDANNDTLLPSL